MVGTSPCASCKLLRRRCGKDCVFAAYFPSDDPQKFAIVHKVFGASNVSKMLQELPLHHRPDAVNSLVYEANARARDPVYGCVGAISYLQNQVSQLQMQLAVAQAEILCIQMQQDHHIMPNLATTTFPMMQLDEVVDDKSCFLQSYNLQPHLLNFSASGSANTASSNSSNVIYETFKKESLYGHDMVS